MRQHEIDLLVGKTLQSMKINEVPNQNKTMEVHTPTIKPLSEPLQKPVQTHRYSLRRKIFHFSIRIAQLLGN